MLKSPLIGLMLAVVALLAGCAGAPSAGTPTNTSQPADNKNRVPYGY